MRKKYSNNNKEKIMSIINEYKYCYKIDYLLRKKNVFLLTNTRTNNKLTIKWRKKI